MKTFKKYLNEDLPCEQYIFELNKFINDVTEEEQIEAVQKNGYDIRYISNPSEKVQLIAIQQEGAIIKHIENPSEKVQLAAVDNNLFAIMNIKNPTFKVINLVFQRDPYMSRHAWFPWSEEFQDWLIDKNLSNIFKIPRNRLSSELKEKYKYLLSMNKAGILK